MSHPLEGAWRKVERAYTHLEALDQAISDFEAGSPEPYTCRREFDSQRSEYVYYLVVRRIPPHTIALILGDFVHNLRSALDYIAWQSTFPTSPAPLDDRTQFPIFDRLRDFPSETGRRLGKIRPDILRHMKTLQPYHRARDDKRFLLRVLRDVSNLDKHRNVTFVAAQTELVMGREFIDLSETDKNITYMWTATFQDGDPFAWVPARASDGKIAFEPEFAFKVALGERDRAGYGFPVVEIMAQLYEYIRFDLIPGYSRFFPQGDNPFLQ